MKEHKSESPVKFVFGSNKEVDEVSKKPSKSLSPFLVRIKLKVT